jgi:ubiquinone/menaquinone biosynthesis C-methylase UbiE
MLARARAQAGDGVELRVMDAERLGVEAGSFDAVLLHQVLEVVGDPVACLAEAARALRPGGRISVFDKFLPDGAPRSRWRAAWARALDLVFTSVKHRFADLLEGSGAPLCVERTERCRGAFRILLLRRPPSRPAPSAARPAGGPGRGAAC